MRGETDFALAPADPRRRCSRRSPATTRATRCRELPGAFAGFAARRWGMARGAEQVRLAADVMSAWASCCGDLTEPATRGRDPPCTRPFFMAIRETGGGCWRCRSCGSRRADASISRGSSGHSPPARAPVTSSATRTTRPARYHERAELEAVAALAEPYGMLAESDEVHAPMTPGATHTPSSRWAAALAAQGVCVHGSLEGVEPGGLKTGGDRGRRPTRCRRYSPSGCRRTSAVHASIFGVLASTAAFEHGEEWLARARAAPRPESDAARRAPAGAPARRAWAAARRRATSPGSTALARSRRSTPRTPSWSAVASPSARGVTFGEAGRGFARLNFGTSSAPLAEAVRRMASAVG